MRIPRLHRAKNNSPIAWWEWPLLPVLAVSMLAAACVSLLLLPPLVAMHWWLERRFLKSLCSQRRFVPWTELEPRLIAGEGTLLVEQAQKMDVRVWWVQEDVLRVAPMPPAAPNELDYNSIKETPAFVYWCFKEYINFDTGKASLTVPPFKYPRGFVEQRFFNDRFPRLSVVMTVRLD